MGKKDFLKKFLKRPANTYEGSSLNFLESYGDNRQFHNSSGKQVQSYRVRVKKIRVLRKTSNRREVADSHSLRTHLLTTLFAIN